MILSVRRQANLGKMIDSLVCGSGRNHPGECVCLKFWKCLGFENRLPRWFYVAGGDGKRTFRPTVGDMPLTGKHIPTSKLLDERHPPHSPGWALPAVLWPSTCGMAKTWPFQLCSLGDTRGHFSRVSPKPFWVISHPPICDCWTEYLQPVGLV